MQPDLYQYTTVNVYLLPEGFVSNNLCPFNLKNTTFN